MKKTLKICVLASIAALWVMGCESPFAPEENKVDEPENLVNYFPLDIGNKWVFEASTVTYNGIAGSYYTGVET